MADVERGAVHMLVRPKGNILNDSDSGVDYLGHSVYAEALAEKIERVSTPITIGVFARWGSGKSFLLKHVKNLLDRKQRQSNAGKSSSSRRPLIGWRCRCCLRTAVFIFLLSIIIVSSIWAAHPSIFVIKLNQPTSGAVGEIPSWSNTTSHPIADKPLSTTATPDPHETHFSRYVALSILLTSLLLVGIIVCGNNDWWSNQMQKNLRLLLFVAFTKLPIKNPPKAIVKEYCDDDMRMMQDLDCDDDAQSNKKYIFVDFNAWEYAGSDTLWAGIVTTLSNAIEAEFGRVTTRMFRMFQLSAIPPDVRVDGAIPKQGLIYVRLPSVGGNSEDRSAKETMMQFGVVKKFCPLKDWNRSVDTKSEIMEDWWVVKYSNLKETQKAFESLSLLGLEVSCSPPFVGDVKQPNNNVENELPAEGRIPEETSFINTPPPRSVGSSDTPSVCDEGDEEPRSCFNHFMKHPKTICNIPTLFWHILSVFAVICLPVITYTLADMLQLDVYRTGRAVPVVVQVISWLPAVGAASFVIIKFIWAMFHSQRNRITSALAGTKGNMAAQLGFMNKVKTEVQYVTKLLKCAEFSHNQQYRVIISIDDLDRCAFDKIKSVLEAIGILLSDCSSPFVCLIAVDSRVAVKCIEDTMSIALLKSNVTGHEYLKKIINLPFCLPEIDNRMKKHFIDGLMELADETRKERVRRRAALSAAATPVSATRRVTMDARSYSPRVHRSGEMHPTTSREEVLNHTNRADHFRAPLQRKGTNPMVLPQERAGDRNFPSGDAGPQPFDPGLTNQNRAPPHDVPDGVPLDEHTVTGSSPFLEPHKPPSCIDEVTQTEVMSGGMVMASTQTEEVVSSPPLEVVESYLSTTDFLFECRECLFNDVMIQRHMEGNPRNIKRIFNVLSLTSWILHCYEREVRRFAFLRKNCRWPSSPALDDLSNLEVDHHLSNALPFRRSKSLARDLVAWVILVDQWPYRMSYLLEVLDDYQQRSSIGSKLQLEEEDSLFDIYKKCVQPEIDMIQGKENDGGLLSLDIHPDMFLSFLKDIKKEGLLRKRASSLQQITINLDQSIRQAIVRQRELILCSCNEEKRKKSSTKPPSDVAHKS